MSLAAGPGGSGEETKVEIKTSHKDKRSKTAFVTRLAPQDLLEALQGSLADELGVEAVPNEAKGPAYFSYTWVKPAAGDEEEQAGAA